MINFNIEHWPIVYFKSDIISEFNDTIFEEYQKKYLNLLIECKKRKEKIVLVLNLNYFNNTNIPVKYILKQIQFHKNIYNFNKKYLNCIIILCKSKPFKNMINTFLSFTETAAPIKICRNSEKATSYLKNNFKINFDISIFTNNNENENEKLDTNNYENDIINNELLESIEKINNIENIENKEKFTEYFNKLS